MACAPEMPIFGDESSFTGPYVGAQTGLDIWTLVHDEATAANSNPKLDKFQFLTGLRIRELYVLGLSPTLRSLLLNGLYVSPCMVPKILCGRTSAMVSQAIKTERPGSFGFLL
jgi:hypothetical protein